MEHDPPSSSLSSSSLPPSSLSLDGVPGDDADEFVEHPEEDDEVCLSAGDNSAAEGRKRKLELDMNDVAPNCYCVGDAMQNEIVTNSGDGTDGLIFGFAANMNNIGALPESTFLHMLAVALVVYSQDETGDILADSEVLTTVKRKSNVLTQALMRDRQNSSTSGDVKDLYKLSIRDYYKAIQDMEGEESGHGVARSYCGLGGNRETVPMRKARMLITVHKASYVQNGQDQSQLFCVLWVICHRNYDFVGKLHRLFGNPETWRQQQHKSFRPRVESEMECHEAGYAIWTDVMLQLISAQRFPVVQRDWERRRTDDPMSYLCSPYHPESFYALTNPCAVFNSIVLMCPREVWDSVSISGMSMDALERVPLTMFDYLCRYDAWRKMYALAKQMQKQEAAGDGGENVDDEDGEEVDGDENDEEEYDAQQSENNAGARGVVSGEHVPQQFCSVGGDREYINAALNSPSDCECFDDEGRASLAAVLGWPADDCSVENLKTGIPSSSVTLLVDFASAAPSLQTLLQRPRVEEMQNLFGGIPHRARVRVQVLLQAGRSNIPEDVFLMEEKQVSEGKRRRMYQPALNPLAGFMYDQSGEHIYTRFLRDVAKTPALEKRVMMLREFSENMFGTLRGDLVMGKSRSKLLMTMQMYVDALERKLCTDVWAVLKNRRQTRLRKWVGSDFEMYNDLFYGVYQEFNHKHWNLSGRNIHILISWLHSELLWRCGTAGSWRWIGMPVTVVNAAATLSWQGGIDLRKMGTCGYDFVRGIYKEVRKMYTFILPTHLRDMFADDGHVDPSMVNVTPWSIGNGTIHIMEGKVILYPRDLGTGQFFPEGLPDGEALELCLRFIPRDGNVQMEKTSSADPAKNGMRKVVVVRSIDGFAVTVISWARNQHPEAVSQKRLEDLSRVVTILPASGAEDDEKDNTKSFSEAETKLTFCGAGVAKSNRTVLATKGWDIPDKKKREYASFFSMVFFCASLSGLQQKMGLIRWDMSKSTSFILNNLFLIVHSFMPQLISAQKAAHASRFFDSAISMAGVSHTALVRAYATTAGCGRTPSGTATHAINKLTQLQYKDAVHYSLVPSVMMRFLTSVVDFPVLAVMSCLFRELEIPIVSLESVMQMLNGVPITKQADSNKIKAYISKCLREGRMCSTSVLDTELREETNASLYVTGASNAHTGSALRMAFNSMEANNKDVNVLIAQKLQKNLVDVLRTPLVNFAHFCSTAPEHTVGKVLTKMQSNDFNLSEMLGCQNLFYDHRTIAKRLFGPTRFNGIQPMHPEEHNFMRIMPVGGSQIAYGLNLPSCLLMASMMGSFRRDWGCQVNFCKTIVCFMMEHLVPYSLVPVKSATMDSFETMKGVIKSSFDNKYRPLQVRRGGYESLFLESYDNAEKASDGVLWKGLVEDGAHMDSIINIATELDMGCYWKMDVTSWHFEVGWGLPGDIIPLRRYPNNALVEGGDDDFLATNGRVSFVEVEKDNTLSLCVVDPEDADGGVRKKSCGPASLDRITQQNVVFEHGWGPAMCFRRCGVLVRVPDSEVMLTLIPFNHMSPADLVQNGFNSLNFLKDGYYLASDGERTEKLSCTSVEESVVQYGSRVALSHSSAALAPFREQRKFAMLRRGLPEHLKHGGWQVAWLVAQDYAIPSVGTVSLIVKMHTASGKHVAFRVEATPKDIVVYDDPVEYEGCHQHLFELYPVR